VHASYSAYAYEAVADLLSDKFGRSCTIWIIRPSQFAHGVFSCFSNFVHTNDYGAAIDCEPLDRFATNEPAGTTHARSLLADDPSGSATQHLVKLMKNVRDQLFDEDGEFVGAMQSRFCYWSVAHYNPWGQSRSR
jgi:hypothetical protein